jgi:uncharacterized protein (DUF2062 family)
VKQWIYNRVFQPIATLLRQGVDPHRITLSLAFGLGFGIFPVLGLPTILCTLAALVLRLNLPAVQFVNYLAAPLQVLLIIPFVRLGERLVGAAPQPITVRGGLQLVAEGAFHAIVVLWSAIWHAALGWLAVGPILIYLVFRLCRPVIGRAATRLHTSDQPPQVFHVQKPKVDRTRRRARCDAGANRP